MSALALIAAFAAAPSPYTYVSGRVRIELISPGLVRLEREGPRGFEDRATFTVLDRNFSKVTPKVIKGAHSVTLQTGLYSVTVANDASSLEDVEVDDYFGQPLYRYDGTLPKTSYLPAPGAVPPVWTMADNPRLIPPSWGATPAPTSVDPALASLSGWDVRNDAPDVYVFVPGQGGYPQLRKDFLALTGPVPKPPLYMMGFIDSRWYPYTEKEALDSIDTYRSKGIPMDTFVVDTDWRVSGSAGYDVATNYFPDMARFIKEAHDRHAKLMFNDHPDPKAATSTDPKELEYRWDGLTKLLNWGMDVWWYDRNWYTSLHEPMPGIRKEVWGQRLYHDITLRDRPNQRPWIMTNAQGIDNGHEHYPPQPAGHRYPMMWTGDTGSRFEYLRYGVQNGVDRGLLALQPYTHEDLGGHTGPTPSPELYVRYLEYGCLSPITRVHCTRGQDRHPWAFGDEAERIVTDYIKLRYRLLPMLYSAAQHAADDGTPILRRCDLYWPNQPEASHDDQYMLGDDILVAPIVAGLEGDLTPVPAAMFGHDGLKAEYFDNKDLEGSPKITRTDSKIDFDWSGSSPGAGIPQENFSARWTGTLGPVPTSGMYTLMTKNDDGVRVYLDDKLIVDDWKPEDSKVNQVQVPLEAGSTHKLRVEYMQLTGGALVTLGWLPPTEKKADISTRSVWIPPGAWENVWTGEQIAGPKTITASATLDQTPMWVALGGLVLTGPDLQYTGEKPMDPITVDAYVGRDVATQRELVEDDGISNAYLKGAVARTKVQLAVNGTVAAIQLGATKGSYDGIHSDRNWVLRIHLPKGVAVSSAALDKQPAKFAAEPHGAVRIPFNGGSTPDGGDVITIKVPTSSIRKAHQILLELKPA